MYIVQVLYAVECLSLIHVALPRVMRNSELSDRKLILLLGKKKIMNLINIVPLLTRLTAVSRGH